MINVEKLKRDEPKLLEYLKSNNYCESYSLKFSSVISQIIELDTKQSIESVCDFIELFHLYFEHKWKPKTAKYMLGIFRTIDNFENNGIYPNGTKNLSLYDRKSFQDLSPSYQDLLVGFGKEMKGKKSSHTIDNIICAATTFFSFLQAQGFQSLSDISQTSILSTLADPRYPQHNSTSRNGIKHILQFGADNGNQDCERILNYLPGTKSKKGLVDDLSDQEIKKIDKGLSENILSKRDTAILTLMRFTGMRASDVSTLKLSDIDWDKDIITKIQKKTNNPVTLPLLIPVGNAIYDYLESERPVSDSSYLFLSERAPHHPISAGAVSRISIKSLPKLEVRTSSTEHKQKGSHLFRHYVATSLMEQGNSQPLISSVLGQESPNSLNPYLSADDRHLKECGRDINRFPVVEDVFDLEN